MKGIWLDASFADKRELSVGDSITLLYQGMEVSLEIKGLILDSEYIYYTGTDETIPDAYLHGYAVVSEVQARELFGALYYNQVRMNTDEEFHLSSLEESAKEVFGKGYLYSLDREDFVSVAQVDKEIKQMRTMSIAYCTAFMLLAILTMYVTMSRLVNNQRILIGSLKALGFMNWQLRIHYALYGMVVSVLGGIAGMIFGSNVISHNIMGVKQATLTFPIWSVQLSFVSYLMIFVIGFICTISAVVAVNKNLAGVPAEIMRGLVVERVHSKNRDKKKIRLSNQMSYVLRSISRNKIRFLVGVIGVAGSLVLMYAAFGILDSMNYSNEYVYGEQYCYSNKSYIEEYNEAMVSELLELDANAQFVEETKVILKYEENKEIAVVSVISDGNYIQAENLSGDVVELPIKGVCMTKKMSELLHVSKGDTIIMDIIGADKDISVEVVDILLCPAPQGILLSKEAWEIIGGNFTPTSVLSGDTCTKEQLLNTNGISKTVSIVEQSENLDKMSNSVMSVIILLIIASLILGVVIQYNLGMLNYVERNREYATMKVLGFYQKEIQSITLKENLLITLPGWVLGVLLGKQFLNFLAGLISSSSFEWIAIIKSSSFIMISMLCFAISSCVSLMICKKIRKLEMVEALKSVE
jgi:putative ABC transport system permease protein